MIWMLKREGELASHDMTVAMIPFCSCHHVQAEHTRYCPSQADVAPVKACCNSCDVQAEDEVKKLLLGGYQNMVEALLNAIEYRSS